MLSHLVHPSQPSACTGVAQGVLHTWEAVSDSARSCLSLPRRRSAVVSLVLESLEFHGDSHPGAICSPGRAHQEWEEEPGVEHLFFYSS